MNPSTKLTFRTRSFVVCLPRAARPLFVAVDLDDTHAFERAKRFVLDYNRLTASGKAVVRPATACLAWDKRRSCPVK